MNGEHHAAEVQNVASFEWFQRMNASAVQQRAVRTVTVPHEQAITGQQQFGVLAGNRGVGHGHRVFRMTSDRERLTRNRVPLSGVFVGRRSTKRPDAGVFKFRSRPQVTDVQAFDGVVVVEMIAHSRVCPAVEGT